MDNLLAVGTQDPLRKLVGDGRLTRHKLAGQFLYCAADRAQQTHQLRARRLLMATPNLQHRLCNRHGLRVTVAHYPPATLAWRLGGPGSSSTTAMSLQAADALRLGYTIKPVIFAPALGQAGLLIGAERLIRLDAPMAGRPIELDDWKRSVAELVPSAEQVLDDQGYGVAEMFLSAPTESYRPQEMLGASAARA